MKFNMCMNIGILASSSLEKNKMTDWSHHWTFNLFFLYIQCHVIRTG